MRLENWRHFDFWLLGTAALLIIFGVAMIDSAVAGNPELVEIGVVRRQIIFALIGLGIILGVTTLDYHLWSTFGRLMYLLLVGMLGMIVVGGEAAFGAARWLDVGFAIVQPSELAKITIILTAADFFARNQHRMQELGTIVRSALIPAGLVVFIILQPDLSTSIVVLVIWAALLFASGLKIQHLFVFAGLGALLPILGFPFMERYQQQRVVNFLFPDPAERFGEVYNVNQARITIGTGGWLGQGYGQGTQVQLRFLKVRHVDFIYSVISAEFGFVGTVIVMALLLFLIYRILRAARLAYDPYGALICYGVATLIGFQAMVNIGVNLNLMPVTGLPLPFISQGGSSLLSLMLGIGLVESVVTRHRMLEF